MQIQPDSPSAFWTMVGAAAAVVTLLGGLAVWLYGRLREGIRKDFEPILMENQRLEKQLEERFRFPQYAREVIELTEVAAEKRIEALREEHRQALAAHNPQDAEDVSSEIAELEEIQRRLNEAVAQRNRLQQRLQNSIFQRSPKHSKNAIGLPTGLILLVRHHKGLGALKAVDQGSKERGSFIRYAWWYQEDEDAVDFLSPNVRSGLGETREEYPGPSPMLEVGPIRLQWSVGGEGFGWVYYGPKSDPSPDYEFAATTEVDITAVQIPGLEFTQAPQLREDETN